MQEIEVKVENDHIERLTTAKPILALSELIWNAYDADARTVRVEFEEGGLTKLGLIRVQDDGDGIPFEEAEGYFKSLGGSWKRMGAKTKNGRFIHGEKRARPLQGILARRDCHMDFQRKRQAVFYRWADIKSQDLQSLRCFSHNIEGLRRRDIRRAERLSNSRR